MRFRPCDSPFPWFGRAATVFWWFTFTAGTCQMVAATDADADPTHAQSAVPAKFPVPIAPLFANPSPIPAQTPILPMAGEYFSKSSQEAFRATNPVSIPKSTPVAEPAHAPVPEPTPTAAVADDSHPPAAHAALPQVKDHAPEKVLEKENEPSAAQVAELTERIESAKSAKTSPEVEAAFRKILSEPLTVKSQGQVLFAFADYLDKNRVNLIKAAVVYENFLALDPASLQAPLVNLRLADVYYKIGAEKRSLNKYYEVLSSSIRVSGDPEAAALARQAMLKIGNAHFEAGHYQEAAGVYSRLKLLELPPADQAFVLHRAGELLFRQKQYDGAVAAGRQFLAEYPESELVPACRHMIVQSLAASGHQEAAVEETLEILRSTQKGEGINPAVATRWKMETGNDLANVLYANEEYARALRIYQALTNLSNDPSWKVGTVYQIGLCFERLREPVRALEAYAYIAKATLPGIEPPKTDVSPQGMNFSQTQESAVWHAKQLEWMVGVGTKLYPILSSKVRAQSPTP